MNTAQRNYDDPDTILPLRLEATEGAIVVTWDTIREIEARSESDPATVLEKVLEVVDAFDTGTVPITDVFAEVYRRIAKWGEPEQPVPLPPGVFYAAACEDGEFVVRDAEVDALAAAFGVPRESVLRIVTALDHQFIGDTDGKRIFGDEHQHVDVKKAYLHCLIADLAGVEFDFEEGDLVF